MRRPNTRDSKKNASTSKVTKKTTKVTKRGTKKKNDDEEVEFICTLQTQPQQEENEQHEENVQQDEHESEKVHESDETNEHEEDNDEQDPEKANEGDEEEGLDAAKEAEGAKEQEEPEGELELNDVQPMKKKHRGPTKMKHIAKDPNTRERVEFNEMGDPVGEGSVKLSSYLGPLVREHVPVTFDDWRKISEEVKTFLWKSVQVTLFIKF